MGNNDLLLNMYKMEAGQACLVLRCRGRKPCKIVKVLEPLYFAGCMKQLSMAVDTGAAQRCCYELQTADGRSYKLYVVFDREVLGLALLQKGQMRFAWKGTPRDFRYAVDGMLGRMPHW